MPRRRERLVCGLLGQMGMAVKIAQAARNAHVNVSFSDRAERLLAIVSERKPLLIILDWEKCEAEAFKLLDHLNATAEGKKIPKIGFVVQSKQQVKGMAEYAGCDRVYWKTDFLHQLNDFFVRYVA